MNPHLEKCDAILQAISARLAEFDATQDVLFMEEPGNYTFEHPEEGSVGLKREGVYFMIVDSAPDFEKLLAQSVSGLFADMLGVYFRTIPRGYVAGEWKFAYHRSISARHDKINKAYYADVVYNYTWVRLIIKEPPAAAVQTRKDGEALK